MPKKPRTYIAGGNHIGFTHSDGGVTVVRTNNISSDKRKQQLDRARQEALEMEEARKRMLASEKSRK